MTQVLDWKRSLYSMRERWGGIIAFTIGIGYDNPEQVQLLMQYLNSFQGGDGFKIVEATEPEDFLKKLEENKPQQLFLDIDMGEISGIQLGLNEFDLIYELILPILLQIYSCLCLHSHLS